MYNPTTPPLPERPERPDRYSYYKETLGEPSPFCIGAETSRNCSRPVLATFAEPEGAPCGEQILNRFRVLGVLLYHGLGRGFRAWV